jgi:hypothetical protein
MKQQRTLLGAGVTLAFLAIFFFQGTWTLAGVTGNVTGIVRDASGAPLAGVGVTAISPSQTAVTTTDATGHFILLSLAPDTYTIDLSKIGYQSISFPGTAIFADQTQHLALTMTKAIKFIAHVTSQAGSSLVKSGVGGDLYSVNAAQAAAAAALGGGGNLNNAYSAMASVPGIQTSQTGAGWMTNATYVRGQNGYYTGYEYDGIPVNRAFDNYNSSTESTLGLQELQVYTGGGPASVATSGTAGFINQVIKTGTYPGFATANLGIATPTYYHQAQFEVAGSTPDRTFTYYIGLSGYNSAYRFYDNSNLAGLATPGDYFSGNAAIAEGIGYGFGSDQILAVGPTCITGTCQGVKPICPVVGQPWSAPAQGCWQYYNGTFGGTSQISDRENVINLHMGIPHSNGLRDDVQLLWSGSALNNYGYVSPDNAGPGNNQFIYSLYNTNYKAPTCGPETIAPGLTVNGCSGVGQIASLASAFKCGVSPPSFPGLACAPTYLAYADGVAYNLPFGTAIAKSMATIKPPSPYYAPDSPPHPFDGPFPLNDQGVDVNQNDTGITKLQYTHALSQAAYLRLYGYTFYSDWLETAPFNGSTDQLLIGFNGAAQYQLLTHTAGGALDFQDQLNDQNLVTLNGNYTTASVVRLNNNSALAGLEDSPIGYMSKGSGGFVCYGNKGNNPSGAFGYAVPCLSSSYYDTTSTSGSGVSCAKKYDSSCILHPTWRSDAIGGPSAFGQPGSPAARAGATWDTLWSGNVTGSYNTVRPRFMNASLSDQFRPSDKFLVNASLRYDNFTYVLPDSAGAAAAFYSNMTANYTCVLASTNQVLTVRLAPGQFPPASAQYVKGDCNAAATVLHPNGPHTGWVHPNGTTQDGVAAPNFTASSPGSYALNYWEPRISATYTQSPDTVWRVSAGRFTQPPISASVQYLSASGDDRSVWNNTMNLGFYSPFHPIPGISSAQYDASLEHHLRGTDVSFKLTPFYTWVSNWQQQTFIGAGFVTQVPVGVNRAYGAEFQLSKGDFSRNGFSGQLAFTYTNSKVQFQNVPLTTGGVIPNATITLNQAIGQYNALTKAGGGSPCYRAGVAVACSAKPITIGSITYDTVLNPYYNQPSQPLLDANGWYNPYSTAIAPNLNGIVTSYISPEVASLILSYRKNKFAITPSFSFQSGGYYGSPLDVEGLDPRTCVSNSASTGITKVSPKTNPLQCNYLTTTSAGSGPFGFLYIPNPQTGSFAFGSYQNPNFLIGNLQISYDVNPKIRLMLLGTNIFHACFGGSSEPWTSYFPPGGSTCGYAPAGSSLNSTLYPSNFYNGTGINDFAANKARTPAAFQQSYLPALGNNGAIGSVLQPFNLYFNAQIKI